MRWHLAAMLPPLALAIAAPATAQTTTRRGVQTATDSATATATAPAPTNSTMPPPGAHPSRASTNASLWHQPGAHRHAIEIEVFGVANMTQWVWAWSGPAFGAGLRVGIPILHNGPLASVNNDLRVNFGAQIFFWPDPSVFTWWITSPIVLQWNFFLTDRWSVFLEAGAAFDFFPMQGANCYDHPQYSCDTFLIHPDGGIGARFHFGSAGFPTLTLRLAYPTGIDVGVSF